MPLFQQTASSRRFPSSLLTAGISLLTCVPQPLWCPPAAEAAPVDERIEEVYLTLEEALRVVFPESEEVTSGRFTLTPKQKTWVESRSSRPLPDPGVTVYTGRSGGRIDGYAIVTEEIGMYKPITAIVGVTPDGRVSEVAVMVYRESRGGEVKRKRFLSQYRGKGLRDPVRIHKDIINVTGATLSVRSVNSQVRRALAVVHLLFLGKEP